MSRTIRRKNEPLRTLWWNEQHGQFKCHRCGGYHSDRYRSNAPICADGVYSETSMKNFLKEERKARMRANEKAFLQAFKNDRDIEAIAYPCRADSKINYWLT